MRDTGIGIAPERPGPHLRGVLAGRDPAAAKVKGTGLGLPLSRKLAHLLGGDVTVTSVPGEGYLCVPRNYGGPADGPTAVAVAEPARHLNPDRATVLVIDDDEIARYLHAADRRQRVAL